MTGSNFQETCPKCKERKAMKQYMATKCTHCGYSTKNFGGNLSPGWKLKITYDDKKKEVTILGNAEGLEFLAGACLSIIGKTDPSGHIHLEWQMNTLLEGSVQTILEFSNNDQHYQENLQSPT